MGERKVLNKYFPPDFDPSKVPRRRQLKNGQMNIRMMLPMGVRCKTCGNYMFQGTKFNSRIEQDSQNMYLDIIKIYRLYFKCSNCSAEIIIKTDPKNSDYIVETGATRNRESCWSHPHPHKEEKEEKSSMMESLEMKRLESVRQLALLASLEELKSLKSVQATLTSDHLLNSLKCTNKPEDNNQVLEEEEKVVPFIRRIEDEHEHEDESINYNSNSNSNSKRIKLITSKNFSLSSFKSPSASPFLARVSFVKKQKHCSRVGGVPCMTQQVRHDNAAAALQSLGQYYDRWRLNSVLPD
ncbi:hypothetical protein AQUCO_02200103v1 [Aquilegia coerulea]|uniref:Splicing factor YJU2 n=1 Tax=Aquilegia coerulea TaxID=218851 RepID=A0A2G5DDA0_AQUCA|nr:hypothetical protein AQUCO_02200103v1 [Aquilegia coerulea]